MWYRIEKGRIVCNDRVHLRALWGFYFYRQQRSLYARPCTSASLKLFIVPFPPCPPPALHTAVSLQIIYIYISYIYIYVYIYVRNYSIIATARRARGSRDAALKSKLNPETDASYTLKIDLDAARSRDRKDSFEGRSLRKSHEKRNHAEKNLNPMAPIFFLLPANFNLPKLQARA